MATEMKQAKASESDVNAMRDFMSMIENAVEYGQEISSEGDAKDIGPSEIVEKIFEQWRKVGPAWRRVVEGYDVLVHNCCDPNESTLEWKPEIKGLFDKIASQLTLLESILRERLSIVEADSDDLASAWVEIDRQLLEVVAEAHGGVLPEEFRG